MKFGLLIYPVTQNKIFNIGDYIQSIAAKQFLPSVDIKLNREALNQNPNEKVALIANGWYMHKPENWPPHSNISPLFVALHINKLASEQLLSETSINYFKSHSPIGCRDYYTVHNLQQRGVDAYFSGCLTLTLGQTYKRENIDEDAIYFTDVNTYLAPTLKFKIQCCINILTKHKLLVKIAKRMSDFGLTHPLRSVAAFYTTYSKVFEDSVFYKARYKCQEIPNTFLSEDEKFKYADELLKEYSRAKYVVTSRIHCALPCLAIHTPVLYVYNKNLGEIHNCRMDGLIQLFNLITISGTNISCEISAKKLSIKSNFKNKNNYRPLADKLIARCTQFVNSIKRDNK